ncbi:hypothetical protein DFS34DRAFT_590564 [Phlyctochytrium arcticum]|nr:hypothetical protein DFS34DRAFT_590564 [Phlyctochytrium arcticum]
MSSSYKCCFCFFVVVCVWFLFTFIAPNTFSKTWTAISSIVGLDLWLFGWDYHITDRLPLGLGPKAFESKAKPPGAFFDFDNDIHTATTETTATIDTQDTERNYQGRETIREETY